MGASPAAQHFGNIGMASGAQLVPLAQQLAMQIAQGNMAMPTSADGWQNLVSQFSSNLQNLNLPATTPNIAKSTTAATPTTPNTQAPAATDPNGVDSFLSAIRQHESGGNYQAYNAGGGASGAYQFIQSTWSSEAQAAGFTQYANGPASAAPPDVQDAVAKHMAEAYYKQYGSWQDAAEAWYMPGDVGKNVVPDPQAGNTESVTAYGNQIVSMMGQAANNGGPSLGAQMPNMGTSAALQFAQSAVGTPYVWGGESGTGYDCSGLVQAAYKQAGVNLPRTAQAQYDATTKVPAGQQLQAGDLVFFGTSATDITHVGIYVGGGQMIDAPHTGADVRTESYQWGDYVGATRPTDKTGESMLPTSVAPGSKQPTTQSTTGNFAHILNQVMSALTTTGAL